MELLTSTATGLLVLETQPTQKWVIFWPGICVLPFRGRVLWRKRLTVCHLVSPPSHRCVLNGSETGRPNSPGWPFPDLRLSRSSSCSAPTVPPGEGAEQRRMGWEHEMEPRGADWVYLKGCVAWVCLQICKTVFNLLILWALQSGSSE